MLEIKDLPSLWNEHKEKHFFAFHVKNFKIGRLGSHKSPCFAADMRKIINYKLNLKLSRTEKIK